MQPEAKGTTIQEDADSVGAKAVAAKDGIIAIKIKSSRMFCWLMASCEIFEVFEKYKTSIDMITTSEVAVKIVTTDSDTHLDAIIRELDPFGNVGSIPTRLLYRSLATKLRRLRMC